MTVKIQSTREVHTDGVKTLVYGKAGIGKTTLMSTAPRPIILSCESGLLSLAGQDIPFIEIESMADVGEAYDFVSQSDEYDTICLDSISEIAEVLLSELKAKSKDARQAYGDLADNMSKMIRTFRDIKGKNVVFSAKSVRLVDGDTNVTTYTASMPGKNLVGQLPFFFDEVFYMDLMQNDDGDEFRVIKAHAGYGFEAKDRSGRLGKIEEPNLTKIFKKIAGQSSAPDPAPKQEKEDKEEEKTEPETETEGE